MNQLDLRQLASVLSLFLGCLRTEPYRSDQRVIEVLVPLCIPSTLCTGVTQKFKNGRAIIGVKPTHVFHALKPGHLPLGKLSGVRLNSADGFFF